MRDHIILKSGTITYRDIESRLRDAEKGFKIVGIPAVHQHKWLFWVINQGGGVWEWHLKYLQYRMQSAPCWEQEMWGLFKGRYVGVPGQQPVR